MKISRANEKGFFTAVDSSKIIELIGIPSTGTKEVSLALAKVFPGKKTEEHTHHFTEIYLVKKGKGKMHINEETEEIIEGEAVLIPKESRHFIENTGEEGLEFYCICVPAFTVEGTEMKNKP